MTAGSPDDTSPNLSGDWHLDAEPVDVDATEPLPVQPDADQAASSSTHHSPLTTHHSADVPPSPEQLIEAMLFVGGHPLAAATACAAVRGLTPERFLIAIDALARQYRPQRRPYSIQARDNGLCWPFSRRIAHCASGSSAVRARRG